MGRSAKPPEEVFGTADFRCDATGSRSMSATSNLGGAKQCVSSETLQLSCYAVGVLGRLRRERPDLADTIETICLVIVQPRAGSGRPGASMVDQRRGTSLLGLRGPEARYRQRIIVGRCADPGAWPALLPVAPRRANAPLIENLDNSKNL